MSGKNGFSEALGGLSAVVQMCVSFAVPVLIFCLLAFFLKEKFALPDWWTGGLVVLGIAVGINSFVRTVKAYIKMTDKQNGNGGK